MKTGVTGGGVMNSKRLLATFGIMVAVMVLASSVVYSINSDDSDATDGSRSSETITNFGEFVKEVEESNYNYDGHGVTVAWTASSGCWSGGIKGTHPNDSDKKHMFDTDQLQDGNTPNRAIDGCYQYHIFAGVTADISISNVNFVFTTADRGFDTNDSSVTIMILSMARAAARSRRTT